MSYLPSAKRLSVSIMKGQKLARGSQGQAAGRFLRQGHPDNAER
uniref:Oxidoreductase n=1 Tax=Macrostomum lignano TaxID=282301 RepID=A0A1I8FH96_9PLAT